MKTWKFFTCLLGFSATMGFAACGGGSDDDPGNITPPDGNGSGGNSGGGAIELPVYPVPDRSNVPAFPGAHGAGRYVTGGAGGTVYTVTNLNDSGEGSLRWALSKSGKRTIVFAISGTIELNSTLSIHNGDVTIAGQTAPGLGICLKNYTLAINADNVIVRYIRCRLGDECKREDDAMQSYNNKTYADRKKNIMVDHCSLSWSIDECASFYGQENLTLQWCIISESLAKSVHVKDAHGYGGIWGGCPATFHHNLIAHHTNRTPRLNGSRYSNRPDVEKVDLRNNVFYNNGSEGGYAGQGGSYNFVNNYYKPGPYTAETSAYKRIFMAYPDDGKNKQPVGVCGKFYLKGNVFDTSCSKLTSSQKSEMEAVSRDNYKGLQVKTNIKDASGNTVPITLDQVRAGTEFNITETAYTQDAKAAYEDVLAYAGASKQRDKIDARIVKETRDGTYTYSGSNGSKFGIIDSQKDVEGWSEYVKTESTLKDSDGDGMPDEWETSKGLNPNDKSDGSKYNLDKNYTNLEVYLNSLVEATFPAGQLN